MNIWQTLVIKLSHAVVAVLVFVGLQAAPQPQTATVDIQSDTGQVSVTPISTEPQFYQLTWSQIQGRQQTPPIEATVPETTIAAPPAEAPSSTPQPVVVPIYVINQPSAAPTPHLEPAPAAADTKPMTRTIQIIQPDNESGHYVANDYQLNPDGTLAEGSTAPTDANSVGIEFLVRDENNEPVRDAVVTVTATDSKQDKTINGTGAVTKIYENGTPLTVPYYGYYYEFRTSGAHQITFTSATGDTKTITLTAK